MSEPLPPAQPDYSKTLQDLAENVRKSQEDIAKIAGKLTKEECMLPSERFALGLIYLFLSGVFAVVLLKSQINKWQAAVLCVTILAAAMLVGLIVGKPKRDDDY